MIPHRWQRQGAEDRAKAKKREEEERKENTDAVCT